MEKIENETDQEASPNDCLFSDESNLPKSITLCMRDSFVKRDIDHQSRELYKSIENTEEAIIKSYETFAELGNYELKVEKPEEYLVYDLNIPMVNLNNENSENSKTLVSDVKEKVFDMMDIDPEGYVIKMQQHEALGKPVEKDAEGNFKIPKFELNLVLKIKRKHLEMKDTKFQDKLDSSAPGEEMTCDFDQYMPQFTVFKGLRVQWDKAGAKLESSCYEPESSMHTDSKHIKENLTLNAPSNLHRIPNEYIIDFREQLVRDNFKKVEEKQFEYFKEMNCDLMKKYDVLMEKLKSELSKFELEIDYKDVDQLSNLDGNYAVNWFDVKLAIKNNAKSEPAAQESDLCKDFSKDGVNTIQYNDNLQCEGEKTEEKTPESK